MTVENKAAIDSQSFSDETLEVLSEMIAEKIILKMKQVEDNKQRKLIQQKNAACIRLNNIDILQ